MNPFKYSLPQLQKALVSLIFFAGYVAAMFIFVPPGLVTAIAAVVPPAFGVVLVFVRGNHEYEPLNKAITQLQSAVLTVAVYFTAVPASTQNKITMAVGALVSVIAVLWKANAPGGGKVSPVEGLPPVSGAPLGEPREEDPVAAAVAQQVAEEAAAKESVSHEYFDPPRTAQVKAASALNAQPRRPGFTD